MAFTMSELLGSGFVRHGMIQVVQGANMEVSRVPVMAIFGSRLDKDGRYRFKIQSGELLWFICFTWGDSSG
jgi:hypothetical protein